jgi:ribosome recycling factor
MSLLFRRVSLRAMQSLMTTRAMNGVAYIVLPAVTTGVYRMPTVASFSTKSKKGGNKGGKDDSAPDVKLPDVKSVEKSMDGTVNWVASEFAKLKVGRVSADLFSNLPVESYGTVGKAGQVTLKSNTKLLVALYDPVMGKAVADAIRNCGLNLNPTIEGNNVMANIPRPSKESRDALVKTAQKLAEKAKTDIRNMRKDCMDGIKKCKGSVAEDDIKRFTKEVHIAVVTVVSRRFH